MNDATESAPNGRVLLEMRDNVALMTLNDPSVLNAFGFKLKQDVTWGRAVEEKCVGKFGQEALVGVAHLGVACEETEGAAPGDFEDTADALGGLLGEVGLAGIGHVWGQVEEGLFLVVEVRGDD